MRRAEGRAVDPDRPARASALAPPGSWRRRLALGLLVLLVLVAGWALLEVTDVLQYVTRVDVLRARIERLGFWGPLVTVALMAANVVLSPLPSAPIVLAAGAAYGPLWGTVYVLAGAEAGSLIAFMIARALGGDVMQRWFGRNPALRMLGSQTTLMGIVFVSRLVPFMSFDLLSYGAGLTPLTWWRFALANLAGLVPMNLILVLAGAGIMKATPSSLALTGAAVVALAILALFLTAWLRRRGYAPPSE